MPANNRPRVAGHFVKRERSDDEVAASTGDCKRVKSERVEPKQEAAQVKHEREVASADTTAAASSSRAGITGGTGREVEVKSEPVQTPAAASAARLRPSANAGPQELQSANARGKARVQPADSDAAPIVAGPSNAASALERDRVADRIDANEERNQLGFRGVRVTTGQLQTLNESMAAQTRVLETVLDQLASLNRKPARVEESSNETKQEVHTLRTQVDDVKESVDFLYENEVSDKVAELHDQMADIHDKMGDVHDQVGDVHDQVGDVHNQMGDVHDWVDTIHEQVGEINEQTDTMHGQVQWLTDVGEQELTNVHPVVHDVADNVRRLETALAETGRHILNSVDMVRWDARQPSRLSSTPTPVY